MRRECARGAALALLLWGVPVAGQTSAVPPPSPAPATRMPALPPAVIDDALAIGGGDLDARRVRTRMVVPIAVNGHGPLQFVVDSGADTSVISQRRARELQLPLSTPVVLHGTTATSVVDRVEVGTLDLGGSTVRDLTLPVLHERDVGADGLIGIDALVEQRLMLDFETRLIKIEDARRPAPRMDGDIVVVARRRRGQLILTQARANNRAVDAVIDTGSEITIGNIALRDQLLRRHTEFRTIQISDVTGVTQDLQLAEVDELRLGPVVLRNVPIAFADVPPFAAFGLADHPALMLGTDLMATFRRVSLDFRARKVRFQLRRCRSDVALTTSPSASLMRLRMEGASDGACRG